jgi:hypothetical protein
MTSMTHVHWWRAYKGRTEHAWVKKGVDFIAICDSSLRYTSQLWKGSLKRCSVCSRLTQWKVKS